MLGALLRGGGQLVGGVVGLRLRGGDLRLELLLRAAGGGLAALGGLRELLHLTLALRELPFVEAAKSIGMSETRIALRHVLPNTLAPLIVLATAQLGSTILTEASLSFLGLGIPEPYPSWGRMLSESAAEYVRTAPWLVIFPGIAISLAVFGTNLFGDALRDILDPRQRG